jgi:flagellar basal body rod protein FlgB
MLSSFGLAIEQYGILSGTVVDESGVGLPGVEVTISGPALMGTRTTLTKTDGNYRIAQLNVGTNYQVTFQLKGFKKVTKKDVRIELGKETTQNIMMKFGEITEEVIVTGDIPIVDPKSSTNQVNISKEVVETLANDRQYQTIMEMMPGAIPGNNPGMMGASGSDNMYQFDGMESTDPLTKTWSTAMNFDNFEEMQVVAQGAPAEYGRGTGAVINVVTKSGSNQIHGTARVHISKVDWNAEAEAQNTNFDDATHYLNETRPAFNLGGPIIKDHIWFFGSWERRNKWKPARWFRNPTEALYNTPTGEGKGYYKGHYASAKLTMRLGNFSIMGMWSEDPISMPDYYQYTNSPGYPEANDLEKTQGGWNFNSEATTTLGANTYVVARFSMKRNALDLISDTQTGIRYRQSGFYWGAGLYDYKTDRDHDQFLINVSHFMDTSFGYHDWKFGLEYYDMSINGAINYTYPGGELLWYNDYGQTYRRYVYETDVPKRVMKTNTMMTLFVQDKWEVTKGLTLNLGLRLESGKWKNHAGDTVIDFGFGDMLAPRLGVAYNFGKNKFHANWGRFYDLYGWWLVDNYQPNDFVRYQDVYFGEHYGFSDWYHVGTYYATAPATATTKSDDLKAQYMDEFGFGYERVLSNKLSVGISYMHRAWNQKIEDYDPDGDGAWHFENEDDYATQDESWGKTFRKYDAVILTLKKNLGDDKFQFMASYTWSKLRGFSGGDGEGGWGDDPYQHVNSLGYLGNDVRHQLRFYGSVILPFDINFGVNFYWFSGYPYTESVDMYYEDGGATMHDGNYYTYLVDPSGESGRYPSEWRLDLRLEKKFKVKKLFTASVYIDAFNILNQQNELSRDNWLGEAVLTGAVGSNDYVMTYDNPKYGQFTSWYAPMSFFIGAKVEW